MEQQRKSHTKELFDTDTDTIVYCRENTHAGYCYNTREQEEGRLMVKKGFPFLVFPALDALRETMHLRHGFSTRLGGVSEGIYASANFSFSNEDTRERVQENYRRFCKALEVRPERMVFSDQVHECRVMPVDERECCGTGFEKKLYRVDGIMTQRKGITLVNSYADCVPLLFADRKKQIIAGTHSGWRGTAGQIGAGTVEAMKRHYGSKARDLIVVIGPSICRNCYEVGEDVAEAFRHAFAKEEAEMILEEKEEKPGKYKLDLWLANRLILERAGIPAENISVACICTCCNKKLLFSHRATNGKRGNLVSMISMQPD